MKTKIVAILGLMMLSSTAFANHPSLTTDAIIGGAIGGALGGFFGAELGGRDGAIIGSGVGAAIGTAYTTRDHRYHYRPRTRSVHVYHQPHYIHHHKRYIHKHHYHRHYRPRARHCPPGLAMQGRCR